MLIGSKQVTRPKSCQLYDEDDDVVISYFVIYVYSNEWHDDWWFVNWTCFEGNGGDLVQQLHQHLPERTAEKQDKRQSVSGLGL